MASRKPTSPRASAEGAAPGGGAVGGRSASGGAARGGGALYGGVGEPGPPGLAPRLLELAEELRREGLAVGTSELLDAFHALSEIDWSDRTRFREALAATLAKSQEDRRVFELVFERFLFRTGERKAVDRGLREERFEGAERLDADELREAVRQAIRHGSDGEMRDTARLAIAAFGRQGEGSGVIGVDVQRIRRGLGLRAAAEERAGDSPARPEPDSVPAERLRAFERHLRQELERALIERTRSLPPAKPLRELDRALPMGPSQDLANVHRVVAQLRRRLATQGAVERGRQRGRSVDIRRTLRASLETGGVPLRLRHRPRRPRRPELYVLCDVSTSVTSASVFFLSVLHALHGSFRKLRSFVFVERISEVSEAFNRMGSFEEVSRAIATDAGVADVSGYTDYGRVWLEFLGAVADELDPRSSVIVLGDARTNGREPQAEAFGRISEQAGRLFWMNPEPKLYWNYGDSVMRAYEPFCDGVFECWSAKQLEVFVNALAGGAARR